MGPSRTDPTRRIGVFNPEQVADLPAQRATELQRFDWIQGTWEHENLAPATAVSPTYADIGTSRFVLGEGGAWVCALAADGRENTADHLRSIQPPVDFYLLARGSCGLLLSPEGWVGSSIAFIGHMTMIGINLEWRMRRDQTQRRRLLLRQRRAESRWLMGPRRRVEVSPQILKDLTTTSWPAPPKLMLIHVPGLIAAVNPAP